MGFVVRHALTMEPVPPTDAWRWEHAGYIAGKSGAKPEELIRVVLSIPTHLAEIYGDAVQEGRDDREAGY